VTIPYAGWLLAVALANFVFGRLITFGPYETQTAHSSYADILLLALACWALFSPCGALFSVLLLAWQVFNFFVVWVWFVPVRINQPIVFDMADDGLRRSAHVTLLLADA